MNSKNNQSDIDKKYLVLCINLAEKSIKNRDNPFGCVIVYKDEIIVESGNIAILENDITLHAEIVAMRKVQALLSSFEISKCTLYSNYEPCPMCAFMIRELKFKRVVFSLRSNNMGGYSKWNILGDESLVEFKPIFSKPPEICIGLLKDKAARTFIDHGWLGMV